MSYADIVIMAKTEESLRTVFKKLENFAKNKIWYSMIVKQGLW